MARSKNNWGGWIALLIALPFVMLALLIYFGVTLVHPYRVTSGYSDAECSALNVTEYGFRECTCNAGSRSACSSVYPCVEIKVHIFPTGKSSVRHKSRLYKYYTADYNNELCSLQPCDKSPTENVKQVQVFVHVYGNTNSSATYPCMYNPDNPKEVIVERPNRIAVIMAMFWPSLVIFVYIVGAIILLVRYLRNGTGYRGIFR